MSNDNNSSMLTGLLLMAVLFMVYSYMLQPPPDQANSQATSTSQTNTPSINPDGSVATNATDASTKQQVPGLFQQDGATEEFVDIENEKVKITLSSKGGRVYKVQVKDYVTYDKRPLILMDGDQNRFNYEFFLNNYAVSTQDYVFKIADKTPTSVTFRLYQDDQSYIEQVYNLKEATDYRMDYDLNLVGFEDGMLDESTIALDWKTDLIKQEKSLKSERYTTGVYYKETETKPTYLSESADDQEEVERLDWVAFKQQFFNTTLLAKNNFKRGDLRIEQPTNPADTTLEKASAKLLLVYERSANFGFPMQFYFGPNHYSTLKSYGNGMEKMVPLGWGIFGWVNKWMIIPLFNFFSKYIGNYGIIILLITLIIKGMLFPLTRKSYMSFAKMNVLKPEIEALKEKYGNDPQRLQSEQMKLYGSAGVNPLGGCLPYLFQMPILFAMYRFFPASIELRQQPFLWADDLSSYDSILNLPFNIPLYGDHVSLFCLLSAASSLIYMRMNQSMTPQTGNNELAKQMQVIQYFMPVMLLFIFNSFSAGLTFYFFLSNIISFTQQYVIKKFFINEDKIRQELMNNKKKPRKQSKFQARLEKMMREQQDLQRQREQGGGSGRGAMNGEADTKTRGSNFTPKKKKKKPRRK